MRKLSLLDLKDLKTLHTNHGRNYSETDAHSTRHTAKFSIKNFTCRVTAKFSGVQQQKG